MYEQIVHGIPSYLLDISCYTITRYQKDGDKMQIGIVLILNVYIGILLCQIKEAARESLKDTNGFDKFVMDLIACPILIGRREFGKSRENMNLVGKRERER